MSTESIKRLSGTADGVNKTFTTPTVFKAGTLRALQNGIAYEPDDEVFGWSELSATQIEVTSQGSPFDPDGVLP